MMRARAILRRWHLCPCPLSVRPRRARADLMEALRKMTIMPAQRLKAHRQMLAKGRIRVGADADITIFDPNA